MTIFRWPGLDPFASLRFMQRELDRLAGQGGMMGQSQQLGGGVYPPVNVYNGTEETVVQCEVAGVARADLDISITGDTLSVKGIKRAPADEDKLSYQRRERGVGEFSRTLVLANPVDADKVEAKLENGILTIRLPKSEAAKPRQIPLK